MWDSRPRLSSVRTAEGGCPTGGKLLNLFFRGSLGAGTGRIGEAFVAARDAYVAVDPSAKMLQHFAQKATSPRGPTPALVQADGQALPFSTGTFDVVLIVQVLSGIPGWRRVVTEARRVLRPGGGLELGHSAGPEYGVDSRMRSQLAVILAERGVDACRLGGGRDEIRAWMCKATPDTKEVIAARWETSRSPREFLDRHATGARFAALPQTVKEDALCQLAAWAEVTFGAADVAFRESHAFVLDIAIFSV